jgi:hypothetical protein
LPTNILYWNKISDFANLDNSIINLVRNPQFTTWGNNNFLSNATSNDECLIVYDGNTICDDWQFVRNNNTANVNIFRVPFAIGQTEVPGNPLNYMRITSDAGSGETTKAIVQDSFGVGTLSGSTVSASVWVRSPFPVLADLFFTQNFDPSSGGDPTVLTSFVGINITPAWQQFTGTITVPSVFGKTVGTAAKDYIRLQFMLPLNQSCDIEVTTFQMVEAKKVPPFRQNTINNFMRETDARSIRAVNPTGTVRFGIYLQADPGWILCNDGPIGGPNSNSDLASTDVKNLYIIIWENVFNTYAPVLNQFGVPTTRGFTAIADYNAGKRLTLTKMLGRSLAAQGSGAALTPRAIGSFTGSETVSLTGDQNGPHAHPLLVNLNPGTVPGVHAGAVNPLTLQNGYVGNSGFGAPHENMQPTSFLTAMIKL